MKKNAISILFLIALAPSILSFSLFAAPMETDVKTFNGRIIYIADEYIELKKDKIEIIVYLSDDTVFITKDGTEGDKNIIEICQYADAYYTLKDTKKILNKIVITKQSDCIK